VRSDSASPIVAGHTARYDGATTDGRGATVMSVGPADSFIVPTMAQVGDAVIVTKGAAIEATGLFGVSFPALVEEKCGAAVAKGAADLFWQMSVVEDAMTAVRSRARQWRSLRCTTHRMRRLGRAHTRSRRRRGLDAH